ncbi:MAG: hypothetical protein IJJ51_03085, partial [Kiritimatiellae bacterium]|nr:hypothetical protein [Kiritimatiellia bacterium]
PKGARLSKGMPWSEFAAQGDMFRRTSPEAEILGDLFAAADAARSFDAEDAETEAGKKRAYGLVTKFLEDYAAVADAANTETADLLGDAPPSRAELAAAARGRAADDGRRFSVVSLDQLGVQSQRAVQELAQGRDAVIRNEYGDIEYNIGRPGKIAESGKIKGGIGLMHIVYARMAKDGATLEEALHTAMLVADALETGREVNIQYNKHYFRKGDIEAIFAINPGSDKPVLTGYKIRAGEPNGAIRASSGLRTIPPPRKETVVAALSRILANLPPARQEGAAGAQRFSVSPAEDAAYLDAVRRGDMETAQRMVREAAERSDIPFDKDRKTGKLLEIDTVTEKRPVISAEQWKHYKNASSSFVKGVELTNYGNQADLMQMLGNQEKVKVYSGASDFEGFGRLPSGFYRITAGPREGEIIGLVADNWFNDQRKELRKLRKEWEGLDRELYYTRGTDNKTEPEILSVLVSRNWRDGFAEDGVSVSTGRGHSLAYKYTYLVMGDVVGKGSDGEPVLQNAKALTLPSTKTKPYVERDVNRQEARAVPSSVIDYHDWDYESAFADRSILAPIGRMTDSEPALETVFVDSRHRILKSADPVTYDDAGNVIPLSQRFNPQSNDIRFSVSPVYTGSAADYANRSRQGGLDDGPSLVKVGTGEGSQVYGWGLYGSTVRGVAEGYAKSGGGAEAWARRMLKERGREDAIQWLEHYGKQYIGFNEKRQGEILLEAAKLLRENKPLGAEHLYEQTFFTNRAPGDESHLLKWYEAVTKENMERIRAQLLKEGVENAWLADDAENDFRGYKAEEVYANLARTLGSAKAASEFLARAGIDGVKYPVDSYGKTVKDGDKAGWNYVSFRDDNIRVDHKWTDGKQRYSVATRAYNLDAPSRLAESFARLAEDASGRSADGKLRAYGLEGLSGEAARERAYAQAAENEAALRGLVGAAARATGAEASFRPGLKKRERVDEKAAADYGGDYSRVADLIGGTLALPPDGDMAAAVGALRRALPPGASIAQVKKLSRPESGGYWDAKVSVRFANGGLGEVIVADANVLDAKMNRGGHDLYDFQRALEKIALEESPESEYNTLYQSLKDIEQAIYSHKTAKAAEYHAAEWDRIKSSASSSLTRLELQPNLRLSSEFMGRLKELLEGSHLQRPASLDSYATPASSFIQNDIGNTSLLADTADGGNDSINPPVR